MKGTVIAALGMIGISVWAKPALAAESEVLDKARACAGCHRLDGNSLIPLYPKLAGQHKLYLAKAMKAYQTGLRKDSTMKEAVRNLSEKDIKDLAAYFAAQKQR